MLGFPFTFYIMISLPDEGKVARDYAYSLNIEIILASPRDRGRTYFRMISRGSLVQVQPHCKVGSSGG